MKLLNFQVRSMSGFVFKCILLVFSAVCFGVGLAMFLDDVGFKTWCIWGLLCCIPMIGNVISSAATEGKKGAIRGAKDYTATVTSDSVTVSNHPFMGMFISICASVLVSVIIGPIFLGISMIGIIICSIKFLANRKSENKTK